MRKLVLRTLLLTAMLAALMAVSVFALDLQGGIINTESAVNMRAEANTSCDILDRLYDQSRVAVLGLEGDFYQVAYKGVNGYIHKDYVTTQDIMNIECGGAKISTAVLNLRAKPTTDSDIVAKLYEGEVARIIGINAGWLKVQCGRGTGYIHPDYMTITTYTAPASSGSSGSSSSGAVAVAADNSGASLREQIIDYAANFLGVKYVYGGSTPSSGFDCSGFVKYVYNHFGLSISRSSASQYNDVTRIKKADLNIGDLVFFSRSSGSSTVGHVGIYVGNGEFIHAPSPGKSVCYDSLSSSYYSSHYVGSGTVFY